MRILRWLGIILLVLAVLLVVAGALLWQFRPQAPEVVLTDPMPEGSRIEGGRLFANFYPGTGQGPRPAILLLGGSEGGIGGAVHRMAVALQAEGFSVLAPSYYRGPGQPEKLELIPLELFDEALAALAARPEVDPSRLAIMGVSKGAEAALIVATRHPEIRAVVAGVPSSVAWQGIDWNFQPTDGSWSLDGKAIPYLPYARTFTFDVFEIYSKSLDALAEHPDAIIPVEKIEGSILLICGEADRLWPSCRMARQIVERAAAHAAPTVTLLAYEDAGHAAIGLPIDPQSPSFDRLDGLGGTDAGNNAARTDGWPKTLEHLKSALQ